MFVRPRFALFAAAAALSAAVAFAADTSKAPTTQPTTQPAAEYPLKTCPVSGDKLGVMGKPFVTKIDGREVRLCCKNCEPKLKADPAKYLKKMDEQIIAAQLPTYPRKTCVVSGDPLDKDSINLVRENRLIRVCCKDCIADIDKDPAKFAKLVDEPDKK